MTASSASGTRPKTASDCASISRCCPVETSSVCSPRRLSSVTTGASLIASGLVPTTTAIGPPRLMRPPGRTDRPPPLAYRRTPAERRRVEARRPGVPGPEDEGGTGLQRRQRAGELEPVVSAPVQVGDDHLGLQLAPAAEALPSARDRPDRPAEALQVAGEDLAVPIVEAGEERDPAEVRGGATHGRFLLLVSGTHRTRASPGATRARGRRPRARAPRWGTPPRAAAPRATPPRRRPRGGRAPAATGRGGGRRPRPARPGGEAPPPAARRPWPARARRARRDGRWATRRGAGRRGGGRCDRRTSPSARARR